MVLDNGELVRIEFPDEYIDEVYESIDNAIKRGDEWGGLVRWEGCHATYLGLKLQGVNMKRVIGKL